MSAPVSLDFDPDLKARLEKLAEERQCPAQTLVSNAVQQYLDREERRARLRQDVLAAWEDYGQTGLHATAEEVDAWLARLEAGEDAEPPLLHL